MKSSLLRVVYFSRQSRDKIKKLVYIDAIEYFNAKEPDITTYLEWLEQLFIYNDIIQEKKKEGIVPNLH